MSDNHRDIWGSVKESVIKACEEICGYLKNRKCNANTWWLSSGAKDEIQKKKEAYKEMKKIPTEVTKK